MVTKNRLFSLDEESIEYINSIPRNKRSQTIREGLKLHKFQHRTVKNITNPQIKVKIHNA